MRDRNKQLRFRRPGFQDKLSRARRYIRKTGPVSEGVGDAILQSVGLRSRITQFLAGFLVLLIVYFLTISQVFLIKNIEVQGPGASAEAVREVLARMSRERIYFVPSNHVLLLNRVAFLNRLQRELPEIRSITTFKKVFPDRLIVSFEERQPLYIWQSGTNFYLLDQDGVVFRKITNYDPASFSEILITNRLAEEVTIGEMLPIIKIMNFIQELNNVWSRQIDETNFTSFSIPGLKSPDLSVQTGIGFQVYFDLERSAKIQVENLSLLLKREIKPETFSGLSYIDLRVSTTAYYCFKDAPCALENQAP